MKFCSSLSCEMPWSEHRESHLVPVGFVGRRQFTLAFWSFSILQSRWVVELHSSLVSQVAVQKQKGLLLVAFPFLTGPETIKLFELQAASA